jgi:hypothetical protein
LPAVCFSNATERAEIVSAIPVINSTEASIAAAWESNQVVVDACATALEEFGSLIGSAYTARDMMQIVDALNEDGMLRYYGECDFAAEENWH